MRMILDGQEYNYNLTELIGKIRADYTLLITTGLPMKDGSIISFGSNSLSKTLIKALMAPIVIPWLRRTYAVAGRELLPPVRHEDLINYVVYHSLNLLEEQEKSFNAICTSEVGENSSKTIKSITPSFTDNERNTFTVDAAAETSQENR